MKTLTRIIGTGLILAGMYGLYNSAKKYASPIDEVNPELVAECYTLRTIEQKFEKNRFGGGTMEDKLKSISLDYDSYKRLSRNPGAELCAVVNEYKDNEMEQWTGFIIGFCCPAVIFALCCYNRKKSMNELKD